MGEASRRTGARAQTKRAIAGCSRADQGLRERAPRARGEARPAAGRRGALTWQALGDRASPAVGPLRASNCASRRELWAIFPVGPRTTDGRNTGGRGPGRISLEARPSMEPAVDRWTTPRRGRGDRRTPLRARTFMGRLGCPRLQGRSSDLRWSSTVFGGPDCKKGLDVIYDYEARGQATFGGSQAPSGPRRKHLATSRSSSRCRRGKRQQQATRRTALRIHPAESAVFFFFLPRWVGSRTGAGAKTLYLQGRLVDVPTGHELF